MDVRMRINRWTSGRRALLYGDALASGLVQPHFVVDGEGVDEPIASLPGIHRQSVDVLRQRIAEDVAMGLVGHMLFPVHAEHDKDPEGRLGLRNDGPMIRALRALREDHGDRWCSRTCACARSPTTSVRSRPRRNHPQRPDRDVSR